MKKNITYGIFILFITVSVTHFCYKYFIVFPKEQSSSFQYALSKAIPFVLSQEGKYNKIIFSNKNNLYQSYMFFLFYSKYDPRKYQMEGGTISGGFLEKHVIGKYYFQPINMEYEKNILVVSNTNEVIQGYAQIRSFSNLDGNETIIIRK